MSKINNLIERYPQLSNQHNHIADAVEMIVRQVSNGGCIFTCGNGGSAADAEHIAGELMKSFVMPRPLRPEEVARLHTYGPEGIKLAEKLQRGIKSIPLTGMLSLSTAFINDCDPYGGFAQQAFTLCCKNDCLIAISTSGNSQNIIYAACAARAKDACVISLTGRDGGKLRSFSDICIIVPETETYIIQELHLPIYHTICLEVEKRLFNDNNSNYPKL